MKNKKLIYGLGLGVVAYLLYKNKSKIFGKKASAEAVEKVVQEAVKPKSKLVYRGVVRNSALSGINTYLFGHQSLNSITRGKSEYGEIFTTSGSLKATQTDNFFLRDSKGNDYTIIGVNNSGIYIKGNKRADFPNGSQFEIRKKV